MPHRSALVIRADEFIVCRHPNAVLNNALVLAAEDLRPARHVFHDTAAFALWCRDEDDDTIAVLDAEGFQRDVTTRPMRCNLEIIAAMRSLMFSSRSMSLGPPS